MDIKLDNVHKVAATIITQKRTAGITTDSLIRKDVLTAGWCLTYR